MENNLTKNFIDTKFVKILNDLFYMENKKKLKGKKDLNEKDNINDLKQFIHKNKKENLVLKKILKKINQPKKNDEQDN